MEHLAYLKIIAMESRPCRRFTHDFLFIDISLSIWRFPKSWGYPQSSSILDWNFPLKKTASYWGSPVTIKKAPSSVWSSIPHGLVTTWIGHRYKTTDSRMTRGNHPSRFEEDHVPGGDIGFNNSFSISTV